jgi:hypothetical protein
MTLPAESADRVEVVRRMARSFVTLVAALILFSPHSAVAHQSGDESLRIRWKPVEQAQVKIDDKTPLAWNIYQPDKKDRKEKKDSDLVLVLLGHRYLMLDIKARLVYVVQLSDVKPQGTDFESGDLAQPSKELPSSDWTVRDVGPAELIRLTLGDYGRVLQVQLPHPPDLRPFY